MNTDFLAIRDKLDAAVDSTFTEIIAAATARAEAAEAVNVQHVHETEALRVKIGALEAERDELAAQVAVCVQALELIDSHGVLDYRFINKIISNLPAAARELIAERDRLREKCAPVDALIADCTMPLVVDRDGCSIKDSQCQWVSFQPIVDALNGFSGVQP